MVIKRFSNMLGSRHGANPFSRSKSHDAPHAPHALAEEPVADSNSHNYGDDTPEGNAARGVVRATADRYRATELTHGNSDSSASPVVPITRAKKYSTYQP
jgi:hypothetical protein